MPILTLHDAGAPRQEPGGAGRPRELFAERRKRYLAEAEGGVTVLAAAPELIKSRDTEVRYRPDSDLFYLTGFEEPEAVAVLTPHDPEHRFTLFVRPRDPEREAWNGTRAGVEGAREQYGADAAYPIDELARRLPSLLERSDRILYALGSDTALDRQVTDALVGFRRSRPRSGRGPAVVADPETILAGMRMIKDADEIERMRVAARIAAEGHRAAMAVCGPGVGEWEMQAALEGTFRALGATGPAFPSIVGSGGNAATLHYVVNDRRVQAGELVLIDAGAEFRMYASDISRTFPASGRFSDAQRRLYGTVLAALEAAIGAIRPGAPIGAVHDAAVRALVEGLVGLGLLQGEPEKLIEGGAHKRFYMHQTSHWLGLDVHDVGPYTEAEESVALRPGMVLTVEPGIYIAPGAPDVPEHFRGVGIRIEDDVLVTEDGHEILTRGVPVAPDEIEALVGSAR